MAKRDARSKRLSPQQIRVSLSSATGFISAIHVASGGCESALMFYRGVFPRSTCGGELSTPLICLFVFSCSETLARNNSFFSRSYLISARIKDGVWRVFTKETESQEVRSNALRPLRQLLKLKPPTLGADRWEVKALACYHDIWFWQRIFRLSLGPCQGRARSSRFSLSP